MNVRGLVGCALLVLSVSTCKRGQGALSATGYVPKYSGFELQFHDPGRRSLMPPDWQLDNFMHGGEGFVPKRGSDYMANYFLDLDEDGETDDVGSMPIYDLRFTHRKNSGVIWIRSIPQELGAKDQELRVLTQNLVNSFSGGGIVMVQLHGVDYLTSKERHFAARIRRRAEATLAGKPAYLITADVSNVDTLKVDPNRVDARVTLVLSRTGASHEYPTGRDREFPLVLVLGHANLPEDFASTEPDFLSLLSRIKVAGQTGFRSRDVPETPDQPEPARPAPPPRQEDTSHDGDAGADSDAAPAPL